MPTITVTFTITPEELRSLAQQPTPTTLTKQVKLPTKPTVAKSATATPGTTIDYPSAEMTKYAGSKQQEIDQEIEKAMGGNPDLKQFVTKAT